MDRSVIENRKDLKRNRIMQTVRYHDGISRSDVKKMTGYSMTTVLNLIEELIGRGLLMEEACTDLRAGRRPTWLHLRPQGAYSIGVEFNADAMNCVVMDLTGNILHQMTWHMRACASSEEVLHMIFQAVEQACEVLAESVNALVGIGVGVPGYLDRREGVAVEYAHMPAWRNVPICHALQQHFHCPVCLENNINTTAIAYRYQTYQQEAEDFVLVSMKFGIRMGIYLNNHLFVGGGNAGEIGHIRLANGYRYCSCGQRGCLDTEASWKAIRNKIIERMQCGQFAALKKKIQGDVEKITMDMLVEQVLADDADARELLQETAAYLGQGLSMVLGSLNPRHIVVATQSDLEGTAFAHSLRQVMKELAPSGLTKELQVSCVRVRDTMGAVGAALLAMEEAFQVLPWEFEP